MKFVDGIALPDKDTHFGPMIEAGPKYMGKGTYQYHKLQAALDLVIHRRRAIDIGAHVGLWTRVLSHTFDYVSAFEPIQEHHDCLIENIVDGSAFSEIRRCALGDAAGRILMEDGGGNTGNARPSEQGWIEVQVRRLDEFKYRPVDFIKIDVEGYELPVLKGAHDTILLNQPVIVVEQKPGNAQRYGFGETDAVKLLKEWGYRIAWNIGGDYCLTPGSA